MNDLLFCVLILVLLYYFFYYLPNQKQFQSSPKLTHTQSTQTDLKDKPITNLINQWNQVAEWAKEEGIDINKKWNLSLLKSKLTNQIKDLQNQLSIKKPIKIKYSRGTQTNSEPEDESAEKTLEELIKNIQDFNKKL